MGRDVVVAVFCVAFNRNDVRMQKRERESQSVEQANQKNHPTNEHIEKDKEKIVNRHTYCVRFS